ncbi:Utp14-domain-containing protein [Guyanagaster necrorhizus]|uniref:Utp14-domain-containing protein n=1 Tax=Guyanagaster necrorhizus TaxID=856835 RepID=A0A9P7VLI2_9AGAR|nr:Utp14-domain-containing protein [Guyanagaster necrorhizus MCA 3950]KAG7442817.1 Utp14-domain-containing protein [Guyanagaster necrorhizus MCA 3950]
MARLAQASRRPNTTTKKPHKNVHSKAKFNAAGYAKRQARKVKEAAPSEDVYEYVPDTVRRSKVKLDLDKDEDFGGIPDGDDEREQLRARLIGENEDDEMIDSEDDEDINSDAAFEESDEDRFAGFFSRKKKGEVKTKAKPSVRFTDVDLNEDVDEDMGGDGKEKDGSDVEEDEEGEDDEFIDVLDMLDGRGETDNGTDTEAQLSSSKTAMPSTPSRAHENVEGGGNDEEEKEDEEDEEDPFTPSDEDEAAPEALENLQNFVSTLDTSLKKRKPSAEDLPVDAPPRKRRILKERTEAGEENEFRTHGTGSKLNLDDLLAPLASQPDILLSLKKSAKILNPSSSSKIRTLSAPLPQRAQERLDREAAYEKTKEEVDKWSATMKQIQEAEHLSFPLQAKPEGRVSALELAAKFQPITALESSVDALLKTAKLRDEDIHETEEGMLKMNNLSVEEVTRRRAELRKTRELMFRAEIKAKRVAKIKSKTYRKIKRKEKERLGEKINEGGSDEEVAMQKEMDRARERATLRHKNTGKWARQMRGKESWDEEGRKGIEEMLDRGERLRRRIAGKGSDESDDDSDDEESADSPEDIRQHAFDELARLDKDDGELSQEKSKGKGVFEMKFMKDAMARQQNETNKIVDDFVKELGGGGEEGRSDNEGGKDPSSGVVVSRTGGRVTYRPGAPTPQPPTKTSKPSTVPSIMVAETEVENPELTSSVPAPASDATIEPSKAMEESNPWLAAGSSSSKVSRKKNEVVVDKNSNLTEKSKNKLKKKAKKTEKEKAMVQDDAVVEISVENVLTLGKVVDDGDDDSDGNSEVETQEKMLETKNKKGKNVVFEQRDLVKMAFAGDNVVKEFEELKRREIEADAPKEVDTTLPGWGSWGGAGTRKAPPKPSLIKKVAGVNAANRADRGKGHVIISEKRDKKAAKYLVKDLPYPYTSKAQFERGMEQPLGVEWNTRVGFQKATLPRVVKKMGTVIDPLQKIF